MSTWINGHCIDGSGSLAMGDVAGWNLPRDLTADEADAINEAIGEWAAEDPDGDSDAAAARLDRRVAEIVAR